MTKMAAPMYNVYVGSEIGLLKGINVTKSYWHNLNELKEADKKKELCCMLWKDDSETDLILGLKNKQLLTYSLSNNLFSSPITLDGGKGNLRNVFLNDNSYITALDSGLVNVWKGEESVCEINCGENLFRMAQNPSSKNIIGTGGKETELKIWDLNDTEKPIFMAKNVRHDRMELRVPVWIMGIGFLQNDKIVTCTGHHQVRVYDPKVQRRPVLDMRFDEYPLTALAVRSDNEIVVGNTQGKMALIDIRNRGKLQHTFKGFAGAIRSIHCHSSKPFVASCGLDRFLRVHDLNSKKLINKVYLKSRLNCVLFSKEWPKVEDEDQDSTDGLVEVKKEVIESDEEVANEADDIWDKMEVVKTRTLKKEGVTMEEKPSKRKKVQVIRSLKKKKIRKA